MGALSPENVEIITAIVGLVVSIVAVVISVLSLKLTRYSIEESNRPYVVIYRDYVQVLSNIHEYIIIKNYGKTGAVIDSIEFKPSLNSQRGNKVFENINNTFIAPGQAISTVISNNPFEGDRKGVFEAIIKYHDGKKNYKEVVKLNDDLLADLTFSKTVPSKSTSIEEVVTKVTQEILRRQL